MFIGLLGLTLNANADSSNSYSNEFTERVYTTSTVDLDNQDFTSLSSKIGTLKSQVDFDTIQTSFEQQKLFDIALPSVETGCGGIDAFLQKDLVVISADQLEALGQSIQEQYELIRDLALVHPSPESIQNENEYRKFFLEQSEKLNEIISSSVRLEELHQMVDAKDTAVNHDDCCDEHKETVTN
jgi:hypothetical protein